MSAKKVNQAARQLLMFTAIIFVLLLASTNIGSFLTTKKVLGIETQINLNEIFWQDFLDKNPNYIPGWIEIGRNDKVKEIDPNYLLTP
jgi:hypothetical protein